MSTPETCPNCGAGVPPGAKACPECGSCAETGWSREAATSDLGLPDEDFDHADFVRREFGDGKPVPTGISLFWWLVAILVAAAVLVFAFK